ncbi:hypothetical protein [Cryobacterium sp. Y11]|uniref:hypothetical protein n=1 Tax=Cryobacterium sp. Y11 TaxID=2045016 RepID=UPI0018ED4CBA|nr:hypothetical protein [Cryobacterium sp. Y11]
MASIRIDGGNHPVIRDLAGGFPPTVGADIVNLTLTIITTLRHPSLHDHEPTPGRRALKETKSHPKLFEGLKGRCFSHNRISVPSMKKQEKTFSAIAFEATAR